MGQERGAWTRIEMERANAHPLPIGGGAVTWRARRPDRTVRLERRIGRALWVLLALTLLWIGLS